MKLLTNRQMNELEFELHDLRKSNLFYSHEYVELKKQLKSNSEYIMNLIKKLDKTTDELNKTREKLKLANGRIGGLTKYINRLKEIINKINDIFKNGDFEDGCDCLKIEEILKGEYDPTK